MADETERETQLKQLEHLKAMGEKAYDDMYEAHSSSDATAFYSDAKECYYDAIGLANRLGVERRGRSAARASGAHQSGVPQPVHVEAFGGLQESLRIYRDSSLTLA
ncbi:MAG: hypothetical protein ACLP07_08900 [Terracidiphilus sp.]